MSQVYGIHELELKSGVTDEEFERFVAEEVGPVLRSQALDVAIARGDRGKRTGKYVLIQHFASLNARNAAFPTADQPVETAAHQLEAPVAGAIQKLLSLTTGLGDPTRYTDYVTITE